MTSRDRYARQQLFGPIGKEGQERLGRAHVLIVGCGALGAAQANLLARAGVGKLTLIDRDILDWSNLQRQFLYDEKQTEEGQPKAYAAASRLKEINSEITCDPHVIDLTPSNAEYFIKQADLVLDATDNFETRFLLNDVCLKHEVPWVYGACVGSYGLSMNILPGQTPCLRCLFENTPAPGTTPTCDTAGIINPIVMVIASIQCAEATKILLGQHDKCRKGVLSIDLWENQFSPLQITQPRPNCKACQRKEWEYLLGAQKQQTTVLCGRNTVQITPADAQDLSLEEVARRLTPLGHITQNRFLVRCQIPPHTLTLFHDGRALIEGTSDVTEARSLYARYLGS